MGSKRFHVIKYADDIALISDPARGLQKMLQSLEKYAPKNNLVVNKKKTVVMIVKKGRRDNETTKWTYEGDELDVVQEFKYLGYWFTCGGGFKKHTRWFVGKTRHALNATWGLIKRSGRSRLRDRLYLYTTLANAGALYGVEIWGWAPNSIFERLYAKAHTMALGVARNTPEYL